MKTNHAESGRNAEVHRAIELLNELIDGKTHDRRSVKSRWEVSLATADRDLKAIAKVRGVVKKRLGKHAVYRFDMNLNDAPVRHSSVIAACFGASLSSMFEGSVYEKNLREALAFVVKQSKRRNDFSDVDRKFVFVRRGGEGSLPARAGELDDLLDATLRCRWVTIEYRRFNGEVETLRIAPLSMAIYDHQLYLIARSEERSNYAYRFCRIDSVLVEKSTFEYPPMEQYDPMAIFADRFGIFMSDDHPLEDIEIRLDKRWKTYATTHRWHSSQRTTIQGDDVVLRLRVRACPELEAWVLSFGEHAEVIAPLSLRERVAKRIEAMARRGSTP